MRFGLQPIWISLILFTLGILAGRFLNRATIRIPKKEKFWESLAFIFAKEPIPGLAAKRKWWDWIPIIGTTRIAGGRSPYSGRRVLRREPWIEILNGVLLVALYWLELPLSGDMTESSFTNKFLQSILPSELSSAMPFFHWRFLYHLILIEAMIVATFIDFDLMIIPDAVTLPAMAVGVLGGFGLGKAWAVPVWFQDSKFLESIKLIIPEWMHFILTGNDIPGWIELNSYSHALMVSLVGIILGGGIIWIVRIIGFAVLKIEAMGFGDVILMAMVGSFLGWQATLIAFGLSLIFSVPIAIGQIVLGIVLRKEIEGHIPYGPYLCLGSLAILMFWRWIWPEFEIFFILGRLLPIIAIVMCVLLFTTLHLLQIIKRIIGIAPYQMESIQKWSPANQLNYLAGENVDSKQGQWKRENWPGEDAGRGQSFENQWKNKN